MPPVAIGEVMRAGGVGEVVVSNSADPPIGGLVVGHTGWQDHAVASASAPMRAVAEIPGVSPSHFLASALLSSTSWSRRSGRLHGVGLATG